MTLAAEPSFVHETLQKTKSEDTSVFWTEKFGTVTLIYKSEIKDQKAETTTNPPSPVLAGDTSFIKEASIDETTYELTPFREEGTYSDNRHPDEIKWSKSLIADAKRRDFTINCLYYFHANLETRDKGQGQRDNINSQSTDHKAQLNDDVETQHLASK